MKVVDLPKKTSDDLGKFKIRFLTDDPDITVSCDLLQDSNGIMYCLVKLPKSDENDFDMKMAWNVDTIKEITNLAYED